jgi:hypothetical protein
MVEIPGDDAIDEPEPTTVDGQTKEEIPVLERAERLIEATHPLERRSPEQAGGQRRQRSGDQLCDPRHLRAGPGFPEHRPRRVHRLPAPVDDIDAGAAYDGVTQFPDGVRLQRIVIVEEVDEWACAARTPCFAPKTRRGVPNGNRHQGGIGGDDTAVSYDQPGRVHLPATLAIAACSRWGAGTSGPRRSPWARPYPDPASRLSAMYRPHQPLRLLEDPAPRGFTESWAEAPAAVHR